MKNLYIFLGYSLLFFLSCSSVKLVTGAGRPGGNQKITGVQLLAANERIRPKGETVGDFVLKEDNNMDWKYLRNKLENFAREKGANLILIRTIGWGKKGHAFYADGTLFYTADTVSIVREAPRACWLYVMRDRTEGLLSSAFKVEVKMGDTNFGALSQAGFVKKAFPDCNQSLAVFVNNKEYNIKPDGRSKYFRVTKQTSAGAVGGSISLGIGGVYLLEMENTELARLLMYQN